MAGEHVDRCNRKGERHVLQAFAGGIATKRNLRLPRNRRAE